MNFDEKTLKSYRNMKNIKSQVRAGFTIVELLIVVVVIAILAAITIVAYNGITRQADESAVHSTLRTAANKVALWQTAHGSYPSNLGDVDASLTSGSHALEYFQSRDGRTFCVEAASNERPYSFSGVTGSPREGTCVGNADLNPSLDCPAGFIQVPGDYRFGTSDFCIMKYEAKNNGSDVPISQANSLPWVGVNNADSIAYSSAACDGCHLVTDAEWMTVAANVLAVPSNWSGGEVGVGHIYRGHSDNNPANSLAASSSDSNGYIGTGNSSGNQRRTLTLTNGEVIWDLSGNVREQTQGTIAGELPIKNGITGWGWIGYDDVSNWGNLPAISRPAAADAGDYTVANGIGGLYTTPENSALRAFTRGGSWSTSGNAGVLSLDIASTTWSTDSLGFRVAR